MGEKLNEELKNDFPKITGIQFSADETKFWFITEDGQDATDYMATKSEGYSTLRSFVKHDQIDENQYGEYYTFIHDSKTIKEQKSKKKGGDDFSI